MTAQVIDRTRAVKCGKGKQPLRYEVVAYHTERDWDDGTGETLLAKFACAGDAHSWAKHVAETTGGIFALVVRN